MDFLKKAKAGMKDVQDLQAGFKKMGLSFGDKSADQSSASSPPPSTAASTAAFTPATTPAASARAPSVQVNDLNVPHCQAEGAPGKVPLAARKKIRDDFESKKPELEQELSQLLGTPWTIHVDVAGVYTYMGNDTAALTNPGLFIYEYFKGAVSRLQSFKEKYGAADAATINDFAPAHIITLEPTPEPSVKYNSTDFFEGRWRLLFRDTMFGYNTSDAAQDISDVVNRASKSGGAAGGSSAQPAISLNAKKSIRDKYEAKVPEVLSTAQKYLAAPGLVFVPNFETNYATLMAFAAGPDGDKLRNDWENTLGTATLDYYEGFVSQLEWQKFKGDEMMQEGFADAVDKLTVSFLVSADVKKSHNDCIIENGVLVMRTKPSSWWTNHSDACQALSELL